MSDARYGCHRTMLIVGAVLALGACAMVPKESVELSTTVGRDIAAVHEAHRNLANTLFGRMKGDVNRFVDDVYAPYQIQFVLAAQKRQQHSGDLDNLFSVLDAATRRPNDAQAQKDAVLVMGAIVEAVRKDVEGYRKLRLDPVLAQEREVIADIERVYDQIERGNATVTAHLASIRKVHEAQDELATKLDMEGLRERIGVGLSDASTRIAKFVENAEKVDGSLDQATAKLNDLTGKLDELTSGEVPQKLDELTKGE